MTENVIKEINAAYVQLEQKRDQLIQALRGEQFEVDWGWYNGHYHKNSSGAWEREAYPIPVLSVMGLCDIDLSFDEICVSTKLHREAALAYSYDGIAQYDFEAFGVEEFLCDFYQAGMSIAELKDRVSQSKEQEIGFAFPFPLATEGAEIGAFVSMLRREGFHD